MDEKRKRRRSSSSFLFSSESQPPQKKRRYNEDVQLENDDFMDFGMDFSDSDPLGLTPSYDDRISNTYLDEMGLSSDMNFNLGMYNDLDDSDFGLSDNVYSPNSFNLDFRDSTDPDNVFDDPSYNVMDTVRRLSNNDSDMRQLEGLLSDGEISSPQFVETTNEEFERSYFSLDDDGTFEPLKHVRSQMAAYFADFAVMEMNLPTAPSESEYLKVLPKDGYGIYKFKKGIAGLRDGTVYEGEWEDYLPNGKGTFFYSDGSKYHGEVRSGASHGKGMIYIVSKDDGIEPLKASGDFVKGSLNGRGSLFSKNGRYDGDWIEDHRNGYGRLITTKGEIYVGFWKDSKYHGKGYFRHSNGDQYYGDFVMGLREGKGELRNENGNTYEGNFKRGMQNGFGKKIWNDGSIYVGYFKDGLRHGNGKMEYPNGNVYEGEYVNDIKSGTGKMTAKDNSFIMTGNWVDGYPHGEGYLENKIDGEIEKYKGNYKRGVRCGYGEFYYRNGDIFRGLFANDLRNGKGLCVYDNGCVYVGTYKNDKKHGLGMLVYPDKSGYFGHWKDGKMNGPGKIYYCDGTSWEGNFVNNLKNGMGVFIHPTKQLYEMNQIVEQYQHRNMLFDWFKKFSETGYNEFIKKNGIIKEVKDENDEYVKNHEVDQVDTFVKKECDTPKQVLPLPLHPETIRTLNMMKKKKRKKKKGRGRPRKNPVI